MKVRRFFVISTCAAFISGGAAVSAPRGEKQVINTPNAPAAIGPYSQAIKIKAKETMYLAGQLRRKMPCQTANQISSLRASWLTSFSA